MVASGPRGGVVPRGDLSVPTVSRNLISMLMRWNVAHP